VYVLQRPPQNDDELYELVYTLWGVKIPRTPVCPDHATPFQAFADAFFGRTPVAIWKASRGLGGKSRTLAYLTLTEAVVLGADANILGGSGAQSQNVHEAMRDGWNFPLSPSHMLMTDNMNEMRLSNQAKVKALMASQRSVRGPHPQRLRLDEIDEMDVEILDAALGQPMPTEEIDSQVVLSSTHQYPDKCVAAGTLVLTRRGEVPVEDVESGDEVMTRKGWRRVKHQMMSGYRPVVRLALSNGRVLTCTDDHRLALLDGTWTIPRWLEPGAALAGLDPRPFTLTGATDAPTSPEVGVVEGMASCAVGLPGVEGRSANSSKDVLPLRGRFQVLDVDTGPVAAQMVDLLAIPQGSDEADERPAVSAAVEVLALDPAVPLGSGPAPDPAPVFVDDAPVTEPVFVVDSHIVRVLQPVYDLEVEDQHEFVAEGVVVHNTMTEMLHRANMSGWPVYEWCWKETSNDTDGWLPKSHIKRVRETVTQRMWEVEYDLQEPTIGSRAFDTEKVEEMFVGYRADPSIPPDDDPGLATYKHHDVERGEQYEFEPPDLRRGEYVTGADWAKEQDWTVIATFRTDCDPWRLVAFSRTRRKPYPLMVRLFNKRLERFPGGAIHDATGLGNVIADYLDERVKNFIMSGRDRDDMLTEYINAVEKGALVAPKIETAYSEHKYASVEDIYGRGKDNHLPDTVCAMALCWHMRNRVTRGVTPVLDLEHEGGGSPWRMD